jgi:hypothetical protein
MTTKKEFVIEFSLLGKRIKTTLRATNEEDAMQELCKAIMKKTKIYSLSESG